MMKIADFVAKGINVTNNMGEFRKTTENSIVFRNGWVASIIDKEQTNYPNQKSRFSVAVCNCDGYFNWDLLKLFGNGRGTVDCETEDEVCTILTIIESLNS